MLIMYYYSQFSTIKKVGPCQKKKKKWVRMIENWASNCAGCQLLQIEPDPSYSDKVDIKRKIKGKNLFAWYIIYQILWLALFSYGFNSLVDFIPRLNKLIQMQQVGPIADPTCWLNFHLLSYPTFLRPKFLSKQIHVDLSIIINCSIHRCYVGYTGILKYKG